MPVNRTPYYQQNMNSYGARNMNGGRCSGPSEPVRPCHDRRPMPCARQEQRPAPHPCEDDWRAEVPVGNRRQLLCYIDEVSFAAYDALLYLDTHPNDEEALHYFREHSRKRNFALKEYAKAFGPLTIDTIDDNASRSWEWACQMWPWEGGNQ